jgi:uncharacterized protein HemX
MVIATPPHVAATESRRHVHSKFVADNKQGSAMNNNAGFVRLLSLVVTIIVAGLVLVSFLFLRHGVAAQEQSLLQSDTSQLALVISGACQPF